MNNLNKIIAMRLKHSFYEHKDTYLNFIKHYRKTYKAEYYLTKHLCFLQNHRLAKKFITKATKAEPNNKYIMGVYHLYNKNNEKAVECFLASKGQNRYLDDEIDSYLLSIDPKNINVISECWNGIKLEFKDENDKKDFDELKIREGNTFQVKLQNKITKFLRKKKEMKTVKKQKCEQTLTALIGLKEFLSSNFITNEYVDNMEKELTKLKEFFCNVESYRKGDLSAEEKITNFESELMDVKAVKIAISEKLVKRMVYEIMMKRFEVKENKIGMPFLPIFYDMAYDYVQYPSEQSNVEKLLKGFSFFSRK